MGPHSAFSWGNCAHCNNTVTSSNTHSSTRTSKVGIVVACVGSNKPTTASAPTPHTCRRGMAPTHELTALGRLCVTTYSLRLASVGQQRAGPKARTWNIFRPAAGGRAGGPHLENFQARCRGQGRRPAPGKKLGLGAEEQLCPRPPNFGGIPTLAAVRSPTFCRCLRCPPALWAAHPAHPPVCTARCVRWTLLHACCTPAACPLCAPCAPPVCPAACPAVHPV